MHTTFYVNVNRLIVAAAACVATGMFLHYCKKTGKDPVGELTGAYRRTVR